MKSKVQARATRKRRIRKKISGTPERPRLSVFRSLNHIYAQVVDDGSGKTLASASSRDKSIEGKDKSEKAKAVGQLVAKRCAEVNIKSVVFDRNGYQFHGRVKALADAARETGLEL